MKLTAIISLIIVGLFASTVYFIKESGRLEEELKTKQDAIVGLETKLQQLEESHKVTLEQLELSRQESIALEKQSQQEMKRLNAVLEVEKSKVPLYQSNIKKLEQRNKYLKSVKAKTERDNEAFAQEAKMNREQIRKLQNAKKSTECLKVDLPDTALDELYGVRDEKRGES